MNKNYLIRTYSQACTELDELLANPSREVRNEAAQIANAARQALEGLNINEEGGLEYAIQEVEEVTTRIRKLIESLEPTIVGIAEIK
jgi:methylmalonyl-CoA mutase N-terminal domain/subunit